MPSLDGPTLMWWQQNHDMVLLPPQESWSNLSAWQRIPPAAHDDLAWTA
jgi:hypothetical protein